VKAIEDAIVTGCGRSHGIEEAQNSRGGENSGDAEEEKKLVIFLLSIYKNE